MVELPGANLSGNAGRECFARFIDSEVSTQNALLRWHDLLWLSGAGLQFTESPRHIEQQPVAYTRHAAQKALVAQLGNAVTGEA